MAELLEHVSGFELETDILKPFLGAVDKYVSDFIEVYDDVQAWIWMKASLRKKTDKLIGEILKQILNSNFEDL